MQGNPTAGNPNKSLLKIDKELPAFWRRTLIAYGCKNGPGYPLDQQLYDMGPMDFRHIVDQLRIMHWQEHRIPAEIQNGEERTFGVIIHCNGDVNICKRSSYERLYVSASLCDLESEVSYPIGNRVGIPLVARKLAPSLAWCGRIVGHEPAIANPISALLNSDEHDALVLNVGSVLLVREDKKPIAVAHIEGLLHYAVQKIQLLNNRGTRLFTLNERFVRSLSKNSSRSFTASGSRTRVLQKIDRPLPTRCRREI
jgi:hypothetical protein